MKKDALPATRKMRGKYLISLILCLFLSLDKSNAIPQSLRIEKTTVESNGCRENQILQERVYFGKELKFVTIYNQETKLMTIGHFSSGKLFFSEEYDYSYDPPRPKRIIYFQLTEDNPAERIFEFSEITEGLNELPHSAVQAYNNEIKKLSPPVQK